VGRPVKKLKPITHRENPNDSHIYVQVKVKVRFLEKNHYYKNTPGY
jgi:hypothetical protein